MPGWKPAPELGGHAVSRRQEPQLPSPHPTPQKAQHPSHWDAPRNGSLLHSDAGLPAPSHGTERKEERDAALQVSVLFGQGFFFLLQYSTERLLAGQFCGHASAASRLPAACLPLAAFWFELPGLVTFQCKVHFFPPLFPFPPRPPFQEPPLI